MLLTSLLWSGAAFSVGCWGDFRAPCAAYTHTGLCGGFWLSALGSSKQPLGFGRSRHSSLFLLLGICMGGVPLDLTLLFNISARFPGSLQFAIRTCVSVGVYVQISNWSNCLLVSSSLQSLTKVPGGPQINVQSAPKTCISSFCVLYLAILQNLCSITRHLP